MNETLIASIFLVLATGFLFALAIGIIVSIKPKYTRVQKQFFYLVKMMKDE